MEDKSKIHIKKEEKKIQYKTEKEKDNININNKNFDEEKEIDKNIQKFEDITKEVFIEESEENEEKEKSQSNFVLIKTNLYGSLSIYNERSLRDFSLSNSYLSAIGIISSLEDSSFEPKRSKSVDNIIHNFSAKSKFYFFYLLFFIFIK